MKGIIKRAYLKIKNSGNNHECPICGFKAKKFLPAGLYAKRENEKCPDCGSLTRQRQMYLFLKEKDILKDNHIILHFAPEKVLEPYLRKLSKIKYYTSEYDMSLKSDFHLDLTKMNLSDNFCDIIICSHVLEHVMDDKLALSEMFRILKPGGKALIQVPMWPSEAHPTYENADITDPRDRTIHFGQFDHLRIYGYDFNQRILDAKFNLEIVDMEKVMPANLSYKFQLHNYLNIRELIFVCTKIQ